MHKKETAASSPDNCMQVVAAVIQNETTNQILLAKRPESKHMGGLWEFPGGKTETGETVDQTLIRELEEELNITPVAFEPLIYFKYTYPEKTIMFHVFRVLTFDGQAEGKEGQIIKWVNISALHGFEFPPANQPILSAILLPDRYAITGHFNGYEKLAEKVRTLLQNGIRLIRFRAHHLSETQYKQYAQRLTQLCQSFSGAQLLASDNIQFLEENWCGGLHLSTKVALQLYQQDWKYSSPKNKAHKWLAMSCHNAQEISIARAIGAHFVTLSPVCKTLSHPQKSPLGFKKAREITKHAELPVYWLGGLSPKDIAQAHTGYGQGVAAISAYWPD